MAMTLGKVLGTVVLLVSMATDIQGERQPTVNEFKKTRLIDLIFTENLIFQTQETHVLACFRMCSNTPGCVSFTFSGSGACRGHSMTFGHNSTNSNAADTTLYQMAAESCADFNGIAPSGKQTLTLPGTGNLVTTYCDQDTDNGSWTVFQRRQDGSEDFFRNYTDYQNGFGDPDGEFWFSLEALHILTNIRPYEMRVDLWLWDGSTAYSVYSNFTIDTNEMGYRFDYLAFSGNGTDGMDWHRGIGFSTRDVDNDLDTWSLDSYCANEYVGAWWFNDCFDSHLNGVWYGNLSDVPNWGGIQWYTLTYDSSYSFKATEMKIRPMA